MSYTLKQYIQERVPAWEECKNPVCDIDNDRGVCETCHGEGGQWHEAVWFGEENHYIGGMTSPDMHIVTESSFLIRRHDVCKRCKGKKKTKFWKRLTDRSAGNVMRPCRGCLKDADGNPTGAEPGTARPWEVEK